MVQQEFVQQTLHRPARGQYAPASESSARALVAEPDVMDLATLAGCCAIESERFYRGQPHDTRYAYELFRRALVERSEAAWEYVYQHYAPLVDSWVRRSGAFASSGESSEFFVASAFTRFWRAIPPERFESFTTLAALLHYLQRCAGCVVIDSVRVQSWGAEVISEETILLSMSDAAAPDEEAMSRVHREEFWNFINQLLNDESERVVVYYSFVLGMRPGDIYERRKDLFTCINDVYNVKRNVIGRLSRNQSLRDMLV